MTVRDKLSNTKGITKMSDDIHSRDWLSEDYEDFKIIINEGIRVLVNTNGDIMTILDDDSTKIPSK